jgi:hypothetical protein
MTTDDVLARGEELRQQGVDDGGGLWANAEYVDWLMEHGEALMRVARAAVEERDYEDAARPGAPDGGEDSPVVHVALMMARGRRNDALTALGERIPAP